MRLTLVACEAVAAVALLASRRDAPARSWPRHSVALDPADGAAGLGGERPLPRGAHADEVLGWLDDASIAAASAAPPRTRASASCCSATTSSAGPPRCGPCRRRAGPSTARCGRVAGAADRRQAAAAHAASTLPREVVHLHEDVWRSRGGRARGSPRARRPARRDAPHPRAQDARETRRPRARARLPARAPPVGRDQGEAQLRSLRPGRALRAPRTARSAPRGL